MRRYAPAPPLAVVLALCLALVGQGGGALAQGKGKGRGKSKPAAAAPPVMDAKEAKAVVQKLTSPEARSVLDGLAAATGAGSAGAPVAPAIEAILSRGSTAPILKASLDALGAIGAISSSAAIRPYLRHRVPDLRRAAARALGATRGPEAVAAYKEGLRSADGQVRGLSAVGLGNLGVTDALPELFLALDHNVAEAAAAVGRLCAGEDCDKLVARLGKAPLEVMAAGVDPIFFRATPLPEEALIKIIDALRELASPEAGKYLADVLSRWPASGSQRVKQSLEAAGSK